MKTIFYWSINEKNIFFSFKKSLMIIHVIIFGNSCPG